MVKLAPDENNSAPYFVVIGCIAMMNVARNPRFELFHTVDVLGQVASGACFGVARADFSDATYREISVIRKGWPCGRSPERRVGAAGGTHGNSGPWLCV